MQAQPQPTSRAPRDPKTQHAATGQNAAAFRLGPGPPVADPEYLAAAKAFPNLWSPLQANRIVAVDECFGQNRPPTRLLGNPVRARYRSAPQLFPTAGLGIRFNLPLTGSLPPAGEHHLLQGFHGGCTRTAPHRQGNTVPRFGPRNLDYPHR